MLMTILAVSGYVILTGILSLLISSLIAGSVYEDGVEIGKKMFFTCIAIKWVAMLGFGMMMVGLGVWTI